MIDLCLPPAEQYRITIGPTNVTYMGIGHIIDGCTLNQGVDTIRDIDKLEEVGFLFSFTQGW